MENRAAVFTSSPQDVEVYRDGIWCPGSLLGWRHVSGGCEAWVRIDVRGAEETTWLALDLLRLPAPAAAPGRSAGTVAADRSAAGAREELSLTGTMTALRAVPVPARRRSAAASSGRGTSVGRVSAGAASPGDSELTATMNLTAVRDGAGDAGAAGAPPRRSGGRRRAPEPPGPELPAAASDVSGASAASDVSGASAASDVSGASAASAASAVPGRHRAPAPAAGVAGRHRAADTGVRPAVPHGEPLRLTAPPRPMSSVPVLDEPDAHLLTRPMRLGDVLQGGVPGPRRTPGGGRLGGV